MRKADNDYFEEYSHIYQEVEGKNDMLTDFCSAHFHFCEETAYLTYTLSTLQN